jgi:hypothetical protein
MYSGLIVVHCIQFEVALVFIVRFNNSTVLEYRDRLMIRLNDIVVYICIQILGTPVQCTGYLVVCIHSTGSRMCV